MIRTREVDGWLKNIEAKGVLQEKKQEIQKRCLGSCCPKNCRSIYKLGKTMINRFNDMIELKSKGRFEVVEYNLPRTPVEAMLMEEKPLGLDMMYKRVCSCLKDKQIEIGGCECYS